MLSTIEGDIKGLSVVGKLSWDAADFHTRVTGGPSVGEVLMRGRAVKAAAAAGDSARVAEWGKCCIKLAANVMGNDSEVVRLLRSWVSCGFRALIWYFDRAWCVDCDV